VSAVCASRTPGAFAKDCGDSISRASLCCSVCAAPGEAVCFRQGTRASARGRTSGAAAIAQTELKGTNEKAPGFGRGACFFDDDLLSDFTRRIKSSFVAANAGAARSATQHSPPSASQLGQSAQYVSLLRPTPSVLRPPRHPPIMGSHPHHDPFDQATLRASEKADHRRRRRRRRLHAFKFHFDSALGAARLPSLMADSANIVGSRHRCRGEREAGRKHASQEKSGYRMVP
jgi:hypothetical protein